MDKIKHQFVEIRGLKLHIAEIGTGPAVVFLHGFPEIWYSWRHQLTAIADAGFRAIAPDFRGYGLSQQPPQPENTTFKDLVDDLLLILDKLHISKVLLVGKDFGARVVYHFALVHPERVIALATLGVPFLLTGPEAFPRDLLPRGFYMLRWQEPGRAEKDFGRFDVKTVVKNIYIMFSGSELPSAATDDQEIMDLVDESAPLPSWFTEEDLQVYATLYENSGFRTALQVPYRAWLEDYGVDELKVKVPALLIMGESDYALKFGASTLHAVFLQISKRNQTTLLTHVNSIRITLIEQPLFQEVCSSMSYHAIALHLTEPQTTVSGSPFSGLSSQDLHRTSTPRVDLIVHHVLQPLVVRWPQKCHGCQLTTRVAVVHRLKATHLEKLECIRNTHSNISKRCSVSFLAHVSSHLSHDAFDELADSHARRNSVGVDDDVGSDAFDSPWHIFLRVSHPNRSLLPVSAAKLISNLRYPNRSHPYFDKPQPVRVRG